MKVGVLQFFSWPGRRGPLERVYARALDRIAVMDRDGYDAVWLAEHHFSDFSVCPSVHVMGAAVAARTTRLRIGTAVSLALFSHPLRLAEELALLDVLSGGRVNAGLGRGFARAEFDAFGVSTEDSYERFREHVDAVLAAWASERATFAGRYVRFQDVEVLPRPLQRPHPPLWLAASSLEALAWAAGRGHAVLLDPHSSHADVVAKLAFYRARVAQAGHSIPADLPVARMVALAPTARQAEEVARQGARWVWGSYVNPAFRPVVSASGPGASPAGDDAVERYVRDVVVHGTPAAVVEQLQGLQEAGVGYLLAAPLSHTSFLLLTDEVLPKLA